jgi:hypothetical protein
MPEESEPPVIPPAESLAAPQTPTHRDPASDDPMVAIARLTAVVERMQRASASPRPAGNDAHTAAITRRIELQESWVASNRLP